jgi:hypothetical protein
MSSSSASMSDTLHTLEALLLENERYAPSYGSGFTNHLSMVLIALQRLGASSDELRAHTLHYEKRLEPIQAADFAIDSGKIEAHFGDWTAYTAYRDFFLHALERGGTQKTIAAWWPLLMPGVISAGFHALIRLAYGLEAAHRGEIASGLAYMAASYTDLFPDTAPLPPKAGSLAEALNPFRLSCPARPLESDLIIEEMKLATDDAYFYPALRVPPLSSAQERTQTFADLQRTAIRIYLASPDFNSLHLVTGCHALSVFLQHLPEDRHAETLFYFWVGFCAGYVTCGAPQPADIQGAANVDWDTVAAAVRKSDKDHDIKLAYSCRALYQQTHDPAYLAAAAHLLTQH